MYRAPYSPSTVYLSPRRGLRLRFGGTHTAVPMQGDTSRAGRGGVCSVNLIPRLSRTRCVQLIRHRAFVCHAADAPPIKGGSGVAALSRILLVSF